MRDYSKFLKVYSNIPAKLREGIVSVVNDIPYTWNAAYIEIVGNTSAGKEIYHQLIKTGII